MKEIKADSLNELQQILNENSYKVIGNQLFKKDGKFIAIVEKEIKEIGSSIQTVDEYINSHDVKTEKRISKKGNELIKVFYPSGKIAEYDLRNIDRTTAFEY